MLSWEEKQIKALRSCMSVQHGCHIRHMPVQPSIPTNLQPLVVAGPSPICKEIWGLELMVELNRVFGR